MRFWLDKVDVGSTKLLPGVGTIKLKIQISDSDSEFLNSELQSRFRIQILKVFTFRFAQFLKRKKEKVLPQQSDSDYAANKQTAV